MNLTNSIVMSRGAKQISKAWLTPCSRFTPKQDPNIKTYIMMIFLKTVFNLFILNVEIALRIFEFDGHKLFGRAIFFSAKTNKKNHLRSTMLQKKLSSLSLMCIESDVLW